MMMLHMHRNYALFPVSMVDANTPGIIMHYGFYMELTKWFCCLLEWLLKRKFRICRAQFMAFTQHFYDDVLCITF